MTLNLTLPVDFCFGETTFFKLEQRRASPFMVYLDMMGHQHTQGNKEQAERLESSILSISEPWVTIPQDPQDAKSSLEIWLLGLHLSTTKVLAFNHMIVKWGTKYKSFTMVKQGMKRGIRLVRWTWRLRGPTDTSLKSQHLINSLFHKYVVPSIKAN